MRCGGFPGFGGGRGRTRYTYSMVLVSMSNLSVMHLISPIRLTDPVTVLEPVNLSGLFPGLWPTCYIRQGLCYSLDQNFH